MRSITILILLFICSTLSAQQGVAINTDGSLPDGSAMLDVKSTVKGFLMPRMTAAERTAIALPSAGLMVYETTTNQHWIFNGTSWMQLGTIGSSGPQWSTNGTSIFNSYPGNVGIGLNANINEKLTLKGKMLITYPEGSSRAGINLLGAAGTGGGTINFLKPDSSVTGSIYSNNFLNRMFLQQGDNTNQLVLHANGRVGINTSAPTKKLDVVGSIRSRDTISADNDINAGQDINADNNINAGNNINAVGSIKADGSVTGNGLVSGGNLVVIGTGVVSGNLQTNSSLIINDPAAILQLNASGENKGFVQLSGDNIRIGTNAGNVAGNFIVRTNGADRLLVGPTGNVTVKEKLYVNDINTSMGDISLNPLGTKVLTVSTSNLLISDNKPLRREEQGSYDLLPLGYAYISASGNKIRGTSNITSDQNTQSGSPITGSYRIYCDGVSSNSIVQASVNQTSAMGDYVYFIRAVPHVGYVDVFTDTQSSLSIVRQGMNCSFFITIYK